jgi:hypothetical protein
LLKLVDIGLEKKHVQVVQGIEIPVQKLARYLFIEGVLGVIPGCQPVGGDLSDRCVIGIGCGGHFFGRPWLRGLRRGLGTEEKEEDNRNPNEVVGREQCSKSHYVYADVIIVIETRVPFGQVTLLRTRIK